MKSSNKKTGQTIDMISLSVDAEWTSVRHIQLTAASTCVQSNYQNFWQEEQESDVYPVLSEAFFSCLYSCYDDDGNR